MNLRKEPLIFALAALLLGWFVYSDLQGNTGKATGSRRGGGRGKSLELPDMLVPDIGVALPGEERMAARSDEPRFERALFAPPSDTRPLPPLTPSRPPERPLIALFPPTSPGPTIAHAGAFLRTHPEVRPTDGLFEEDDGAQEFDESSVETTDTTEGKALSPEELAQQIAGYKRVYDWIVSGNLKFGRIANENRFEPLLSASAPVIFHEFVPETGLPRYPGQPAITYERDRVAQFEYAATPENELSRKALDFETGVTPGQVGAVLAFARECLQRRDETPLALELAERYYRLADEVASGVGSGDSDAAAKLGLASVLEAKYDFEGAFDIYNALLEGTHSSNPRVLARMGRLEARFRLFDSAEKRFRAGESFGRTIWELQSEFGRFLLDRGRPEEAVAHLELANRHVPADASITPERLAIRIDLGRALVGAGRVSEAKQLFESALQLDSESADAEAGRLSCALLLGTSSGTSDFAGAAESFDLLLDTGLAQLKKAEYAEAERLLSLAERTDPVRAHLALRAASHLAEITGYEERAVEFIERAVEAAPTDTWSLYQRGRLLAQRGDVDGALASLLLALDQELEFPEALAELGRLAHARGDFPSAELYLERAVSVDGKLADVHALRGQNLLELGDVASAETSFKGALKTDGDHPLALLGLAWVDYLRGDSQEAITGFAELDDSRRSLSEEDPYRVYAREQMKRIREHEVKVVWSDRFDRTELQNGWQISEEAGPLIALVDGRARLSGQFAGGEIRRTRMFRELAANRFVSLEADLIVKSGGRARMGLFLAREQFRRNSNDVQAEVLISRHPDGDVQTRIIQRGEGDETPHVEHPAFTWNTGQRVRLRLERLGEDDDARIRVMLDGVPVLEGERVPTLGRASTKLRFGVFVEGDSGRTVEAEVVRVELVYREVE